MQPFAASLSIAPAPGFRSLNCSGASIRPTVLKLLGKQHGPSSEIAGRAVELTRQLVALKQHFPHMLDEPDIERPTFDLHAPLQNVWIDRNGLLLQLKRISPSLAQESILNGIWQIAEAGGPANWAKLARQDFPMTRIDPDSAPAAWPAELMRFVLLAGSWGRIDLRHAMLAKADLRYVRWQNVQLCGADLSDCDLTKSDMSDSNLCDANLSYATMESITAGGAVMRNANLTSVNACNGRFEGCNFSNANLRQADFRQAQLWAATGIECASGTRFDGARLDGAHVSVRKASHDVAPASCRAVKQTADERRLFRERQLEALLSIDENYNALHHAAVRDLIRVSLDDNDPYPAVSFYTNRLLISKRYWSDPGLNSFIVEGLLPPLLERWNQQARSRCEPLLEQVLVYLSETRPALAWPRYCGAISQLLSALGPAFRNRQATLQELFWQHPQMAPAAAALEALEPELSQLCSVFLSNDGKHLLAYENTVLRGLARGTGTPYNCYYFIRDAAGEFQNAVLHEVHPVLHACAMPLALYNITPPPRASIDLVGCIVAGTGYESRFIHALGCRTLATDDDAQRVPLTADLRLMPHFMGFCENGHASGDFQIGMAHEDSLWTVLDQAIGPLRDCAANRARLLLCVGMLFVRYSSSALFGTEGDSLFSIRHYARACLNRAHALDAGLLGASWREIDARLQGSRHVQRGLDCTNHLAQALLKNVGTKQAGDGTLADYFENIYPQSWQ